MLQSLSDARRFIQQNDWHVILQSIHARDTHPALQFIKYGLCGVAAVVVHQLVCAWMIHLYFPVLGEELSRDTRAWNLFFSNAIAFIFGNAFAYWANQRWVFTPGRHSRGVEFLYFTIVGTIAFAAGSLAGPYMIHAFDIHPLVAQLFLIIVTMLVNFLSRKFFVFQK